MGAFKKAHGGVLKNLYLSEDEVDIKKKKINNLPSWNLTPRQVSDCDLLLNGGYSPLDGFLDQANYLSVCQSMRLISGELWPIPIVLDVTSSFASSLTKGSEIVLRDAEGVAIALLLVDDYWTPDKVMEADLVYGTHDEQHEGVDYLLNKTYSVYLSGKVQGLEPPIYYDFKLLRDSPSELRGRFRKLGWRKIIAYHTRYPLHRAQQALIRRAAREVGANLLIHPLIGAELNGNEDHFSRVRCYEYILDDYQDQIVQLSLLNLSTRLAGPKEALWHGIIRKNYGCTHLIVGANHASPEGTDYYPPYAAHTLFKEHEEELDISLIAFQLMVYIENKADYLPENEVKEGDIVNNLSHNDFLQRLTADKVIPEWFSHPNVINEFRKRNPPRHAQGLTIFFTGLSGSGKSTVANALRVKLLEQGGRSVTLLDGDVVRKHLSSELTFSKAHRHLNIQRIGFVASEITKHGGVAICAPIAPYEKTRRWVRGLISSVGGFVLIHMSTSLAICELRDRKGLYAKARLGFIKEFTGISDPYEVPDQADMRIDTAVLTADLAAHRILIYLESQGYIK